MNYRFATEDENYEDYSSGRVLYNQSGATSFPVRLASEIFLICVHILQDQGKNGPYTIYDPCCGGAYMLTTLALRHGIFINKIYASDINDSMISLARRNLSLISLTGLEKRIEQINELISLYKKDSHSEALKSAMKFKEIINVRSLVIDVNCFSANAAKFIDIKNIDSKVDMVITDLPYGDIVNWHGSQPDSDAAELLLNNILPVLSEKSVVAIITNKKKPISNENYKRIERISIGKRQAFIFQPNKVK